MILIEQGIELSARTAIRAALDTAAAQTPALSDAHIVSYWNAPESGRTKDADGIGVGLVAQPNSAEGYNPTTGFSPQRAMQLDVLCVTQPDVDADCAILQAMYAAVRGVFEAAPCAIAMPAGVTFGGMLIQGGGSGELESGGQYIGFSVVFHVSI
jgi:hypothetical protein